MAPGGGRWYAEAVIAIATVYQARLCAQGGLHCTAPPCPAVLCCAVATPLKREGGGLRAAVAATFRNSCAVSASPNQAPAVYPAAPATPATIAHFQRGTTTTLASLASQVPFGYIKPAQTGYPKDSDARLVVRWVPGCCAEEGIGDPGTWGSGRTRLSARGRRGGEGWGGVGRADQLRLRRPMGGR